MNLQTLKLSARRGHARRVAAALLLLCASLPAAQAKDRKPHMSAAVKVIANMSFENKPTTDMLIRQINGKPYLFVQLANAQGVVVVNISKPNKLKIVSSLPGVDAAASQLSVNGNAAVLTAVSGDAASPSTGKGELVLWDVSEPGNPRVVQKFSGVVRVLHDERNYTYVLNQDGLWVVYDKQSQPATEDDNWQPSIYGALTHATAFGPTKVS